jgi:hypothetical protein
MDEVLANDDANVAAVLQASARKRAGMALLRPCWLDPNSTKEVAAARWRADHPDAGGA